MADLEQIAADLVELKVSGQHWSKKIDEIHLVLTGNGTPEKGLTVRVDRIEQKAKTRDRLFWFLLIPMVLLLAREAIAFFATG